jgi:hypothetical protein
VFLEADTGGHARAGRHPAGPRLSGACAGGCRWRDSGDSAQVHRHLVLGACWFVRHGHADAHRVRMQQGMVGMAVALLVYPRRWVGGVGSAYQDTGRMRPRADRVRACARLGALLVAVDGLAASSTAFLGARTGTLGTGRHRPGGHAGRARSHGG